MNVEDEKTTREWILFPIGMAAFSTVVEAAILPIYFQQVAASPFSVEDASVYWSYLTALSLLLTVILAPVLGSIADRIGGHRRLFVYSNVIAILATGGLVFVGRGGWLLAALLYLIGSVGNKCAYLFYLALLPHLAPHRRLDQISCQSYTWNYIGGTVSLALALGLIMYVFPDSTWGARVAFLLVAVWWAVFSAILLPRLPEPRFSNRTSHTGMSLVVEAIRQLVETFRDIRGHQQTFTFLLALGLYSGGISTVILMATTLGPEVGIGSNELIGAIVINQAVGIPVMLVLTRLVPKTGARRVILTGLAVYTFIAVLGYFTITRWMFWTLAVLAGMADGMVLALSRSLFSKMIPLEDSGEYFGLYTVALRLSGIIGPMLFGVLVRLFDTPRLAMLAPLALFFAGRALMAFVDDDRVTDRPDGQSQADGSGNEPAATAGESA
jgi:UMF1 family MFS transporter